MTRKEAIEILRKHNEWRRYDGPIGEGPEMTNPTVLGEAIDLVVSTELTWKDVARIVILADTILDGNEEEWKKRGPEAYYSEVLRIFNEKKKE